MQNIPDCWSCGGSLDIVDTYQNGFVTLTKCQICATFIDHIKDCEHDYGTFKVEYSTGMIQVITKCIKCGKFKKAHKKREFNLDNLGFYDASAEKKYHQNLQRARIQFRHKQELIRLEEKKQNNSWNIQKWYEGYLYSKMWKRKRSWIFERSEGKCERCGNPAAQVHHKTYERLGYENPEDLMAVCLSCHGKEHSENPGLNIINQFKLNDI